jgi:hypothetical protein
MPKQIIIRINPDGTVQAETKGIQGPSCTQHIELIESLLNAETVESAYTKEYYQEEVNPASLSETIQTASVNTHHQES